MDGHSALCNLISWHSKKCARVARSSSSAETQRAAQGQDTAQWTSDWRTNQSQQHLELFSSTPRECSMLCPGRKAAGTCSAVEALSLHESLTRSRTRLRWLHSDVNVGDGPTKYDHRAVTLLREFLQRPVWEIGFTDLHIRPEVARTCSCQEATVSEGSTGVHT